MASQADIGLSIDEAFLAAHRKPMAPAHRERLANYIHAWGGLEIAERSLHATFVAQDIEVALLSYMAAIKEAADPEIIAQRMEREAASLNADADHALRSAADYRVKLTWASNSAPDDQERIGDSIAALNTRADNLRFEADDKLHQATMIRLETASNGGAPPIPTLQPITSAVRRPDLQLWAAE